jgi:AcrR family transcriptional regulator
VRADAQRNRTAVLAAAEAVYAEQGVEVSLNEIARRAEIGNATLYRHFPTREALLSEVYAGHLARYCAHRRGCRTRKRSSDRVAGLHYVHLRVTGDEPRSGRSAGVAAAAVATRRKAPCPPSPRHRHGVSACGAQRQGAGGRVPRRSGGALDRQRRPDPPDRRGRSAVQRSIGRAVAGRSHFPRDPHRGATGPH